MRKLFTIALIIALLGAGWIGFIRWYYYWNEGQENAHQTSEYKAALQIRVTPLRDGFYLLQGEGGNVTALTGKEGILIVDTDEAWVAPKMLAALDGLDSGQVRYVVNTHSHGDHMGANSVFRENGAEIIAHAATLENIKDNAQYGTTEADHPTILVEDGDSMVFNGQTITFHHPPLAHTNGDIYVKFSPANVIATGDVFVANGVPYISRSYDATLAHHLEGQAQVVAMSDANTVLVPGHGDAADLRELVEVHDDLSKIETYVVRLRNIGIPLRFIPYFHPLYAWPMEKRVGFAWERYWLGLVHGGLE